MRPCMECGELTNLSHHVIPVSLGGTKTVPLCPRCHSRAHGVASEVQYASHLVKLGIERARTRGVRIGAPPKIDDALVQQVFTLRADGLTYRQIAAALGLAVGSVHGCIRKFSWE